MNTVKRTIVVAAVAAAGAAAGVGAAAAAESGPSDAKTADSYRTTVAYDGGDNAAPRSPVNGGSPGGSG